MPKSRLVTPSFVVTLSLASACLNSTSPTVELRVGTVCCYNDGDPQVVIPDTARAGVPAVVSIVSYGDGCYRGGPTEVVVTPSAIEVTPFDTLRLQTACIRILRTFHHTVQVTFDTPGTALVRVRGLIRDTAAVYEQAVVVQ